jgi:hypothetical protein
MAFAMHRSRLTMRQQPKSKKRVRLTYARKGFRVETAAARLRVYFRQRRAFPTNTASAQFSNGL